MTVSSTARGGKRSPADNYPTPFWPTRALLKRVGNKAPFVGGYWLEPSAGLGNIITAVNASRSDVRWTVIEKRKQCRLSLYKTGVANFLITDFLKVRDVDLVHKTDLIIGNPPFSLAQQFIEHGLMLAPYVCFLLRLNYLGTEDRNAFFQRRMPDIWVVPNRISFTRNGRADSIEYAWMLFGREGCSGRIEVLDDTPLEERQAG